MFTREPRRKLGEEKEKKALIGILRVEQGDRQGKEKAAKESLQNGTDEACDDLKEKAQKKVGARSRRATGGFQRSDLMLTCF